jgi:Rrf2 family protein
MRLSTKGRFAVTAMIDVGLRANAGPVSLADISTRHRISLSYLEQLFSKLRQHGLVVSTRGPRRWLQPGPPCRRDLGGGHRRGGRRRRARR